MNLYELLDKTQDLGERAISAMTQVKPKDLGLDDRAGYRLFVSEEGIAVSNSNRRSLDYYGGFEYVDEEYVFSVGDYTFYLAEDDRVQGHLERWEGSNEEVEIDDED